MLDIRSKNVLKYLVDACNDNTYHIIELNDILLNISQKYQSSPEVLTKIIKLLEKGEYISLKYIDDNQFCLAPTPFGRQFIENDDTQINNKKNIKYAHIRNYILIFIFAFLGSFLGTLIYNLVL